MRLVKRGRYRERERTLWWWDWIFCNREAFCCFSLSFIFAIVRTVPQPASPRTAKTSSSVYVRFAPHRFSLALARDYIENEEEYQGFDVSVKASKVLKEKVDLSIVVCI